MLNVNGRALFFAAFLGAAYGGTCLGAESTNICYITISPKSHNEDITKFTAQELVNAATNIECRAAELDPKGHWGEKVEGLQLSLRLSATNYVSGDPIPCVVLLRNTSEEVRVYELNEWAPLWCYGTEFMVERHGKPALTRAASATNFLEKLSFVRQGRTWLLRLAPRTQCRLPCNIDAQFDCSIPGKYRVKAVRHFPKPDGGDVLLNVSSGFAEFEVKPSLGGGGQKTEHQR
jgi:hypothetical protein